MSRKASPVVTDLESLVMGLKRLVMGAAIFAAMNTAAEANQCEPQWRAEFDEPLNTELWHYVEGDGCALNLCGWGNGEQQTYDAQQVVVRDGRLQITAQQDAEGIIHSGKITTEGKFVTRFGRIEARVKVPAGRGTWPAFWMMPESADKPWPNEGEIDILEWTGNHPHRVIGAVHFGDVWPDNVHYSETLLTPTNWSEGFHTYGVLWEPGAVHWYVDGRIHGTANADHIAPWRWVFDDSDFHLIVNLAIGGTLGGDVFPEDLPVTMEVDWIRIYDHSCHEGLSATPSIELTDAGETDPAGAGASKETLVAND